MELSIQDEISLYQELLPILEAQQSLYSFVKQSWSIVNGINATYVDGWHIGALCDHLQACRHGDINKLLINFPPRTGKSTCLTVCLTAWWWLTQPQTQFLYSSYSLRLALRDSIRCRRLIESEWYQRRWGYLFQMREDSNTQQRFENDRFGNRSCISSDSGTTGFGGDVLICDDPNNVVDVESDILRENINDWWSGAFSTRYNNINKVIHIVCQQRTHEQDLSGYILNMDDKEKGAERWVKLILPMEFNKQKQCKTIILPSTKGKIWEDPRTKDKEILWDFITPESLKDLKLSLKSEYRIAGQLNQLPAPQEGGIIKKYWFKWWKKEKPPKLLYILQSWDTALESSDTSAYHAMTTWGVFEDDYKIKNLILLNMWRGKMEYPDLRKLAQRLSRDYRDTGIIDITPDGKHVPNIVLVEAKASGYSLIQDLKRAGILVFGFDPTRKGDKIARVRIVSNYIEGGRVWLPARDPDFIHLRGFAEKFLDLCCIFPNGESRDVVDSMTQAFFRLQDGGFLSHPLDKKREYGVLEVDDGIYGIERAEKSKRR